MRCLIKGSSQVTFNAQLSLIFTRTQHHALNPIHQFFLLIAKLLLTKKIFIRIERGFLLKVVNSYNEGIHFYTVDSGIAD